MGKYKMVESVGTTLETVHAYEDMAIHHPSQQGREPGRTYADIDGQREEILRARTSGNQRMVSKDFILLDGETNSSRVTVPSPVSGYVGRIDERNGLVTLYDRRGGGELMAQVRHMDLRGTTLEPGQWVNYGQPLGMQGGFGGGNAHRYGTHVHVDINEQHLDQFKQYIHDIDTGAITPDSYPALLSSPYNPHNFLYMQALAGIHQMESGRNIAPGHHSGNLAAALTVEAVRAGLVRVDRIELNDVGTLARAIQVSQVRDEPWLNAMTTPVGTEAASRQSLAWTSEQARQLDEATRVQQAEQPALVRSAGGMQR